MDRAGYAALIEHRARRRGEVNSLVAKIATEQGRLADASSTTEATGIESRGPLGVAQAPQLLEQADSLIAAISANGQEIKKLKGALATALKAEADRKRTLIILSCIMITVACAAAYYYFSRY